MADLRDQQLSGDDWVSRQRATWDKLEQTLEWASKPGHSWTPREVEHFSADYRRAASDLLVARSGRASPEVAGYLNDLLGRCYMRLYGQGRGRERSVASFLRYEFPRLVRQHSAYLALAALCFAVGFLTGFMRLADEPQYRGMLLPDDHAQIRPEDRVARDTQIHSAQPSALGSAVRSSSATVYLSLHNLRVALIAFACGLLGGVFTAALLFINGLQWGALTADYYAASLRQLELPPDQRIPYDVWAYYWAWLLPHGVPELAGVLIAGAGGFLLGRAILMPGRLTTRESLGRASRPAIGLLLGTIPLFLCAAVIESTISQLNPPLLPGFWLKYGIAAMGAIAVGGYLFGFGDATIREQPEEAVWHRVRRGGVLEVLTPEHAIFRYRLAGLGSRAMALLLDTIWVALLTALIGVGLATLLMPLLGHWLTALVQGLSLGFVIATVAYFGLFDGSTRASPGKRAMGLRVIDQRGLGVGRGQRALRTVMRLPDLIPGLYLTGLLSALTSDVRQRLGDRAAGTLVVEDGRRQLPISATVRQRLRSTSPLDPADQARLRQRLELAERDWLLGLASRRERLTLQARLRLGARARRYFERRTGYKADDDLPNERYLDILAEAVLPTAEATPAEAVASGPLPGARPAPPAADPESAKAALQALRERGEQRKSEQRGRR